MNTIIKKIFYFLLITFVFASSFVITGCTEQKTDKTENTQFSFVQITDAQIGEYKENIPRLKEIVKMINELEVDITFVAFTGDMMQNNFDDEKLVNETLSILNELKYPIHFAPGNHEISLKEREKTENQYKQYFGDLYHQVEYNGVVSIFAYTHSLKYDDMKPLHEIESMLEKAGNKPVLMFYHTPSIARTSPHVEEGWHDEAQKKWQELLYSYNVKAIMAGHFHRDEFHWLENTPLYVAAPVSYRLDRQASFRVYNYDNGKLSYRTYYVNIKDEN